MAVNMAHDGPKMPLRWPQVGSRNSTRLARWVSELVFRPWRCPRAKLEGNLAVKVAQEGPRRANRAQDGQKRAPKHTTAGLCQ